MDLFQSLIGRLQTPEQCVQEVAEKVFQSLIGRLQTRRAQAAGTRREWVSIPHR